MNCPNCNINSPRPHGVFGRRKVQRFKCRSCSRTFSERSFKTVPESNVNSETLFHVIHCLVEGVGIRATSRLTGVHQVTILKLLGIAGERCAKLMADRVSNVPVSKVQVDEIWGYCFKKEGHKTADEADDPKIGDAYTFVGIEAKTKLVLCYEVGKRDGETALRFIGKLRNATGRRFQLTTDGFRPYVGAVEEVFGSEIDYAQLVKLYSSDETTRERYSPGEVTGAIPTPIMGDPAWEHISTSYVERNNLTMRMQMRRLTRLTNGFSRKWENLEAAVALHFGHYNFCQIHGTLRVTPAMEAGITDHVWTIEDMLGKVGL